MKFDLKDPWFMSIVSAFLGALLAGVTLYYLFEYKKERVSENILITTINNADKLLEKDLTEEALSIYLDALKTISPRQQKLYGHIKTKEGACYLRLSERGDKEENINKAIRAFEESLKIYSDRDYPQEFAALKINLGTAHKELSVVRDKEENISKAIWAFVEALEI